MDSTQILKISSKYETILKATGVYAVKSDTSLNVGPGNSKAFEHCLWMCYEIERQVRAGERDKAMRWVCFIQGVLWVSGLLSIDSMRDDNRPAVGSAT
jgi:hypothetical protein